MELTSYLAKIPAIDGIITYSINMIWKLIRFFCSRIPYKNNNLVIIILHKLGDTVFTLPAVNEIVKKYDQHLVTIYCFLDSVPVIQLLLPNYEFRTVEKKEFMFDQRIAKRSARKKLSELKPSTIFDLTGVMKAATLIFNSRASRIVGMNTKYYKGIYTDYSPIRIEPKLSDIYLDAIQPVISTNKQEELKINLQQNNEKGNVLISPGAGWTNKEWGLKNFIELAERLSEKYEIKLITLPNSVTDDISDYLAEKNISIVVTADVDKLIKVIKKSAIIISNDSGPIYIGNLLGKHTFALYGPTNPAYTFPAGDNNHFIQKILKCSPQNEKYCFAYNTFKCPSNECMHSLSVDFVENELLKFIDRSKPEIVSKSGSS